MNVEETFQMHRYQLWEKSGQGVPKFQESIRRLKVGTKMLIFLIREAILCGLLIVCQAVRKTPVHPAFSSQNASFMSEEPTDGSKSLVKDHRVTSAKPEDPGPGFHFFLSPCSAPETTPLR